ncbi:F-box/kelch-repeat protein At3g23880-like [Nicotiana tabacum]|uniref:F-box/kelch-repeat protein At3g23880-like n=1 Tax=Nicotiana tabacum TaxID=4097 RepID=A0A1S3Y8R9_TOBAC|nr:PREDICTED: F-box/kelch-repeat protein At3g23880-like [Nicotiana tabacum]
MADIPNEITIIILSNLPVKSLLRFKCVSESWRSLISSPTFELSNHRRERAITVTYTHYSVLTRWSFEENYRPLFRFINEQLTLEELNCPLKEKGGEISVPSIDNCMFRGSCHGLILLNFKRHLFLWNPATQSCTKVLDIDDLTLRKYGSFITTAASWGLCFDSSKNDYKVVMFIYDSVAIASLKTKEWRRVKLPYDVCSMHSDAWITLHGRLHSKTSLKSNYRGVGLDNVIVGLGVLDECLCMTCLKSYKGFEILIMKEYGVKESWTPLFFIKDLGIGLLFGLAAPFIVTENGKLALIIRERDSQRIVIYNPKDDNVRDIVVHGKTYLFTSVITYVESLSSSEGYY